MTSVFMRLSTERRPMMKSMYELKFRWFISSADDVASDNSNTAHLQRKMVYIYRFIKPFPP